MAPKRINKKLRENSFANNSKGTIIDIAPHSDPSTKETQREIKKYATGQPAAYAEGRESNGNEDNVAKVILENNQHRLNLITPGIMS